MMNDELSKALDQVLLTLHNGVTTYETLADSVDSQEWEEALSEMLDERLMAAEDLEEQMLEMDMLPKAPDPDRGTVESIILQVRSALTESIDELIEERVRRCEEDILDSVLQVSESEDAGDVPKEVRDILEHIKDVSQQTLSDLTE